MQLLADPDIQQVLEAKRLGKAVSVVAETENSEEDNFDVGLDLPEDDPSKELIDTILGGVKKIVSSKVNEMGTRVDTLEALAQRVHVQEAEAQVTKAKQKFDDFGDYQKPMLDLLESNPGLSPEQLYILAKHKSGKLSVTSPSKFTEKPSTQPLRKRPKPRPASSRGERRAEWSNALAESLRNLVIE